MDEAEDVRLLEGRYRLGSVVGRGGMGTVWRAHDELLDRDVAIKEIVCPPYLNETEQQAACRHALREARLAARLRHPNVVGIYDIVVDDGRPWIVMELFPYRSLRDVLREDGPLPPQQVARLGLGVLAGLRAAHSEGIVHRDVKPGNILLSPGGRAVLTDFGIARTTDTDTLASDMLIGSPSYIAPERAWGGQAGPAADLWALGAVLYAAVEGRAPFERSDPLASLTAAVTDEPAPAIHAGSLWPVISGLLRKDPETRLGPAEAELMLRQAMLDGESWSQPATAPGMRPVGLAAHGHVGPQWRSRKTLGALAATVAASAVAATAFALPHGDSPAAVAFAAGSSPSAAASPSAASPSSHTPAAPTTPAASGRHGRSAKPPQGHDELTDSASTSLSVSKPRPSPPKPSHAAPHHAAPQAPFGEWPGQWSGQWHGPGHSGHH